MRDTKRHRRSLSQETQKILFFHLGSNIVWRDYTKAIYHQSLPLVCCFLIRNKLNSLINHRLLQAHTKCQRFRLNTNNRLHANERMQQH